MGIFGKFFGNSGKTETREKTVTTHIGHVGTSMQVSSPYDIGKAFASLVTCAAVKNSEEEHHNILLQRKYIEELNSK